MSPIEFLATTLGTFLAASSGFWVYLHNKNKAKDATTQLLMGLALDKLTFLGLRYISRGWVTHEEYDDLRKYFYEPYVELGGNGAAQRLMETVEKLPFRFMRSVAITDFQKPREEFLDGERNDEPDTGSLPEQPSV